MAMGRAGGGFARHMLIVHNGDRICFGFDISLSVREPLGWG